MTATVYVNGEHAGGHVGGYLGFEIDITNLVRLQDSNEILVRVDNGIDRSLIPSQKADFVLYGALTPSFFINFLLPPMPAVTPWSGSSTRCTRGFARVRKSCPRERAGPGYTPKLLPDPKR